MTSFEELVVLVLAGYVALMLPTWSEKIVPETIGSMKISGAIKIALQLVLAWFAARVGWIKLNEAIDIGLYYLKEIAQKEQIARVIELREFWLAIGAFVFVFWLVSLIFRYLPKPENVWGTVGAVVILVLVFFAPATIWKLISNYITYNLIGAEGLLSSDAWQAVKGGLN
jgi:hypothetical protein